MMNIVPLLTLLLGIVLKSAIVIVIAYFVMKKTNLIATKSDIDELKQEIQELKQMVAEKDQEKQF